MVEKINVKSHTRKTSSGSTKVEAHTRLVDTETKEAMKKLKKKEIQEDKNSKKYYLEFRRNDGTYYSSELKINRDKADIYNSGAINGNGFLYSNKKYLINDAVRIGTKKESKAIENAVDKFMKIKSSDLETREKRLKIQNLRSELNNELISLSR